MPRGNSSNTNTSWSLTIAVAVVAAAASAAVALQAASDNNKKERAEQEEPAAPTGDEIAVAFAGNSMQYYNDCPRLVEQMLWERFRCSEKVVHQDSCLRGGATLPSLWRQGNGMAQKFATAAAEAIPPKDRDLTVDAAADADSSTAATSNGDGDGDGERRERTPSHRTKKYHDVGAETVEQLLRSRKSWDFLVLNDHTQAPARESSRQQTVDALIQHYAPCILQNSVGVTILIQTPAYRVPGLRDTRDLGDTVAEVTDRLRHGLRSYRAALQSRGVREVRIAPVGEAYRRVRDANRPLWRKLYHGDDFHPSPHGTWLQACVLWCTMFNFPSGGGSDGGEEAVLLPPVYRPEWWEKSRVMQPSDEPPLPRPTAAEARELRRVACWVCCGVTRQAAEDEEDEPERLISKLSSG